MQAERRHSPPPSEEWLGSPYVWLRGLPPVAVAREARGILLAWLRTVGVHASDTNGPASLLVLPDGRNAAVKVSLRWAEGRYHFQQIKDWDYSLGLLYGLSPNCAHLWAVPRAELLAHSKPQHSEASRVLAVYPDDPPPWLAKYGGDLDDAARVLGGT